MGFLVALPAAIGTLLSASTATTAAVSAASVTLAETATLAAVAGAGIGAYGSIQQAHYQSKVAQRNADIAAMNATQANQEGAAEESIARTNTGRKVASAIAAEGANGIDVGFGTPQYVQQSLQNEGDLDALTIRYNASRKALGYVTQSQGYLAQSSAAKSAGTYAALGGALDIGSTFLSGATSVSKNVSAMKVQGITF